MLEGQLKVHDFLGFLYDLSTKFDNCRSFRYVFCDGPVCIPPPSTLTAHCPAAADLTTPQGRRGGGAAHAHATWHHCTGAVTSPRPAQSNTLHIYYFHIFVSVSYKKSLSVSVKSFRRIRVIILLLLSDLNTLKKLSRGECGGGDHVNFPLVGPDIISFFFLCTSQ